VVRILASTTRALKETASRRFAAKAKPFLKSGEAEKNGSVSPVVQSGTSASSAALSTGGLS